MLVQFSKRFLAKVSWYQLTFAAISLVSVGAKAVTKLEINHDGMPIVAPGIFTEGCEYGPKASLSDHAPILWPKERIGTWNITSRVSHKFIGTTSSKFLGHKFLTDSEGKLVTKKGRSAISGHASETNVLTKQTQINQFYRIRLKRIAFKIKELFKKHSLNYLTIQEVPFDKQLDADGSNLRNEFWRALGPELTVLYPEAKPQKKGAAYSVDDKAIDVAIVTRTKINLKPLLSDEENRLQAGCNQKQKHCVVSAHLLHARTPPQLAKRCQSIAAFVQKLFKQGYKTVFVAGDFNTNANQIQLACKTVPNFSPIIHASKTQKAQSCKNNDGDHALKSIDLLIIFNK